MNILFASERLLFRQFTMNDASLIYELNSSPDVLKYIHEPATTLEMAPQVLQEIILPQYEKYGHGRWALHLRDSLEFIGWCGLKRTPDHHFPNLGYRFFRKHWGKGYATEAAKRTIEYGFAGLRLPGIFAAAHVDNIASQKVLEKCVMQFLGIEEEDGIMAKTYELLNPHS